MDGPASPGCGATCYDYSLIVGPLLEPAQPGQRTRRPGGAPNGCASSTHAGHETAAQRYNARLLQAGYEPESPAAWSPAGEKGREEGLQSVQGIGTPARARRATACHSPLPCATPGLDPPPKPPGAPQAKVPARNPS
ncbi:UNVERIFIED_CONTAM: hypothetical protein K2H54_077625 [Gekko kuhli]